MSQRDGLLLGSEESDEDVPDLDLPRATGRKQLPKLCARTRQNAGAVINKSPRCGLRCVLTSVILSLITAIVFLGFLSVHILRELDEIRSSSNNKVLFRELDIVKNDLYRLKTDLDMVRMVSASPGTPVWNVSTIINDRMDLIEKELKKFVLQFKDRLDNQSERNTINALTKRVDQLEETCAKSCASSQTTKLPSSKDDNGTKDGDKTLYKRSKGLRVSSLRDAPVIFTRKHLA